MKLLSRQAQVSLDILQLLQKAGDWRTGPSIAEEMGESTEYVWTLLRKLRLRGYVDAMPTRGYKLNPAVGRVRLRDFLKEFGRSAIQNALRGDTGAANRLLHKIDTVFQCTFLDELIR